MIVLDASVLVPLLVPHANAALAREAVAGTDRWLAPDLVLVETANALWRMVQAGALGADEANDAISVAPSSFDELVPAAGLIRRALTIGVALGHPVYDCLYVALAEREGAKLLTADGRLVRRLRERSWAADVELVGPPER